MAVAVARANRRQEGRGEVRATSKRRRLAVGMRVAAAAVAAVAAVAAAVVVLVIRVLPRTNECLRCISLEAPLRQR